MKLPTNILRLSRSERRGLLDATLPRDERVYRALAVYPGCEVKEGRAVIPAELVPIIEREMGRLECIVELPSVDPFCRCAEKDLANTLHDYQKSTVGRALDTGAWMLNDETGCGKTVTTIAALQQYNVRPNLVVCPALVRLNWKDELKKWWPNGPEADVIDTGKKAAEWDGDTAIVSYELLSKMPRYVWGSIVLDEVHYIGNVFSNRSRVVNELGEDSPDALRLALTATPITNQPKTLHNQLDWLLPGSVGSWTKFQKRYSLATENAYAASGFSYGGLNPDYAQELQERLAQRSSRVTKAEVAHLLPPFQVQVIRVPPRDRGFNVRELLDRFVRMDSHRNDAGMLIRACGEQKVESTLEQVGLALSSGTTHVAALTHLRETARQIAHAATGAPVVYVDGETPIKKRIAELKRAAELPSCILVTTMHAVNVGIDLTRFTVAVFAELDYTPANVIQALGRFSRLSGKLPSTCILLVLSGTQDELVASRVLAKVKDINAVVKPGQSEQQFTRAMEPDLDDTDFLRELQQAASVQLQENYL